ncbi:unnamed protein product (mitochondrion) [Plasmodiophora brassicae]|uniref:Uncharacterized protein n=1 Tax=Plasmodiophora brassicae TaxID=37360 RepID=A0A0G4IX68_PLABS|nr:hypothetical protein PBRA_007682 [Plasmodiophora brassicae]SPQ99578.1 unnamed protein product [Plasmodiophora brassicae]
MSTMSRVAQAVVMVAVVTLSLVSLRPAGVVVPDSAVRNGRERPPAGRPAVPQSKGRAESDKKRHDDVDRVQSKPTPFFEKHWLTIVSAAAVTVVVCVLAIVIVICRRKRRKAPAADWSTMTFAISHPEVV